MESLMSIVNASQKVQAFQADNAKVSTAGSPTLKANLIAQRPHRFRLRAGLFDFTGTELDLGSNDNLLWIWLKQQPDPAVYFVRHDQFESTAARIFIPVNIKWMIEATGLVYLDPTQRHEGPFKVGQNKLEVRTQLPNGLKRILIFDNRFGWVLEQHLKAPNGQLVASVLASKHRYYPRDGLSMPHRIKVRLLPGNENETQFQLDIPRFQFNNLMSNNPEMWKMPQPRGYKLIDLAKVKPQQTNYQSRSTLGPSARTANLPDYSQRSYAPRFRGDASAIR